MQMNYGHICLNIFHPLPFDHIIYVVFMDFLLTCISNFYVHFLWEYLIMHCSYREYQ